MVTTTSVKDNESLGIDLILIPRCHIWFRFLIQNWPLIEWPEQGGTIFRLLFQWIYAKPFTGVLSIEIQYETCQLAVEINDLQPFYVKLNSINELIWKHLTVSCLYVNSKIRREWSAVLLMSIFAVVESSLSAAPLTPEKRNCCTRRARAQGFWGETEQRPIFFTSVFELFNAAVCWSCFPLVNAAALMLVTE